MENYCFTYRYLLSKFPLILTYLLKTCSKVFTTRPSLIITFFIKKINLGEKVKRNLTAGSFSQYENIVSTGCVATGLNNGIIKTTPLGSCVAVIAFDKTSKTGGIAHIMLPCKSPKEDNAEENKYAENAIENLLDALKRLRMEQSKHRNLPGWRGKCSEKRK